MADSKTSRRIPHLVHSITETIGATPLLELHRIVDRQDLDGRLLLKLDYLNPGFSKKDRVALAMVQEARRDGSLQPGQTVVELTSGNTGTGLAIVCRSLDHPFVAVISRGNTVERSRMMQALGAEIVLVDQAEGSPPGQVSGEDLALVAEAADRIVVERDAFRADQFELSSSANAHEYTTGPEIWEQSGGTVDAFVNFVGSGGNLSGVTTYLQSVKPEVRSYAVEPAGAAVLAGQTVTKPNHPIQGGGYSMTDLTLLDITTISGFLQVTDKQVIEATRLLAFEEGVFAGFSTGANLAAAIELLQGDEAGSTIALMACDSGLKYLSTDLYS